MTKKRAAIILDILREKYRIGSNTKHMLTPFETLIMTVISQNTNDNNTRQAFECLSKQLTITPEALSKNRIDEIESCLRTAGLYRKKARTIKEISNKLTEKNAGSLELILSLPLDEARSKLMNLPGVGPKTADVILLFSAGKPTIPVDTHVFRVAKRLHLVHEEATIEATRGSLQKLYSPKDYYDVHLLLISLGKTFCKARKPICAQCPLNPLCPSRTSAEQKCTA